VPLSTTLVAATEVPDVLPITITWSPLTRSLTAPFSALVTLVLPVVCTLVVVPSVPITESDAPSIDAIVPPVPRP
jgi:hypothetical protein